MAKLLNPLLSSEARGKFGGTVYNTWRGIAYAKEGTAPAQPRTSKQLAIRALMIILLAAWRELTPAERATWTDYANNNPQIDWTGRPKRLTGQNWFIRCSMLLSRLGEAPINEAPILPRPDGLDVLTITEVAGDIKATWTTPSSADLSVEFLVNGPISPGRAPRIEFARFEKFVLSNIAKPVTVLSNAPSGMKYGVYARVVDPATGLASGWQLGEVIVA